MPAHQGLSAAPSFQLKRIGRNKCKGLFRIAHFWAEGLTFNFQAVLCRGSELDEFPDPAIPIRTGNALNRTVAPSLTSALHLPQTITSKRALRVALVAILILLTAIVFLFVLFFFVFGLFPHANVGGEREIRWVRVKVFCIHSVHAQWYATRWSTTACNPALAPGSQPQRSSFLTFS